MDIKPLKPLPAGLMALIGKECESARAHMDRYTNFPMWFLTTTWEKGMQCPLYIDNIICDKESAVAVLRCLLAALAQQAFIGGDIIKDGCMFIWPAVEGDPDHPDLVMEDMIYDHQWATDPFVFVDAALELRRAGKTE